MAFTVEQVERLRRFFGRGIAGAEFRRRHWAIPDGLTAEALREYGRIAREVIAAGKDRLGVQQRRLELVERALEELEGNTMVAKSSPFHATKSRSANSLVLIFGPELILAISDQKPASRIRMAEDDREYREVGLTEFTGFYDWLRARDGRIAGVRYWPSNEVLDFIRPIAVQPYVRSSLDEGHVDVLFTLGSAIAAEQSDDQDFGARLFVSPDGQRAISLDISTLSETELSGIFSAETRWQTLHSRSDGPARAR